MRRLLFPVLISLLIFTTGVSLGCRDDNGNNRGRNQVFQPKESTGPNSTDAPRETVASADDVATARAVIQRAVEAHGGIDRLAKLKSHVRTMKGAITKSGGAVPATYEISTDLPGKCRWQYELDTGNQKVPVVVVLNGDKGWVSNFGAAREMSKQQLEEVGDLLYASLWVTSLAALRDPAFELAPLPDIKVADQPAAGVKVVRKGQRDVKLYFDKKTGLLVKAEYKGKEAGLDVTRAYLYSEPKDFDGLKLPTKQVEIDNDKKAGDWTITGYKFPDKLDESTFNKP